MKCSAWVRPRLRAVALPLLTLMLVGCGSTDPSQYDPRLQYANVAVALPDPLANYPVTGDVTPMRDPSIIHVGSTYYIFSTDVGSVVSGSHIPIRCSGDAINWRPCGSVFADEPQWVKNRYYTVSDLWAPDISYFNGLYHLYYSVDLLGTTATSIGLATNVSLDPKDPTYRWVDQGEIFSSPNAQGSSTIDPNIFVDDDGRVWLSYGSYGTGLFQQEVDPGTGRLIRGGDGISPCGARRQAVRSH